MAEHHSDTDNSSTPHSKLPNTPHSKTLTYSHSLHSSLLTVDHMAGIPPEYHEFHEVFSGDKADTLPPHRPYDLGITLEEGAKPISGPIYSLSPPELVALCKFLDKNTQNGFICPTKSLWGLPVLFVKKEDGSLWLCIDFHALTKSWRRIATCYHSLQTCLTPPDLLEST